MDAVCDQYGIPSDVENLIFDKLLDLYRHDHKLVTARLMEVLGTDLGDGSLHPTGYIVYHDLPGFIEYLNYRLEFANQFQEDEDDAMAQKDWNDQLRRDHARSLGFDFVDRWNPNYETLYPTSFDAYDNLIVAGIIAPPHGLPPLAMN